MKSTLMPINYKIIMTSLPSNSGNNYQMTTEYSMKNLLASLPMQISLKPMTYLILNISKTTTWTWNLPWIDKEGVLNLQGSVNTPDRYTTGKRLGLRKGLNSNHTQQGNKKFTNDVWQSR